MQHTEQPISTIISMVSAAVAIIMADVQTVISITAGMVAILSGCMAIRHYYYSTKKTKKEIENDKGSTTT